MENFIYYNPAKIIFGVDSILQLKEELIDHKVTSLLILSSGPYIEQLGIRNQIHKICKELAIHEIESNAITPNPKIELVRELAILARKEQVDFILAVGGGSVIDTAKATSIAVAYDGDVWDFFEGTAQPKQALNIGVISTIPASGSESSNAAILSNGEWKRGIEFDCLIPCFAILDPQYTITLPSYQISCGCADILSHLMERYLTNSTHVDTTDYMIEGAIQALMKNALILMKDAQNLDARSEIQCLAFIAHNNLLDSGRVADWGAHRIEHELSASYGITHGEGMSITLLGILRYDALHNPHKLVQLYDRLWHSNKILNDEEKCEVVLQKLTYFFEALHLKTRLTQLQIGDDKFQEMADRATNHDQFTIGHYIPLNSKKIIEILYLCL